MVEEDEQDLEPHIASHLTYHHRYIWEEVRVVKVVNIVECRQMSGQ